MKKRQLPEPLYLAPLCLALLAGCGGGGSSSTTAAATTTATKTSSTGATSSNASATPSTTTSASTIPAGTSLATAQYASGTAQAAMFNQINSYRQACGFPLLQENTLLDQAAQNHVQYMVDQGGVVSDSEVSGATGFTGVTGQDRANHVGWPSAIGVGTGSASYYSSPALTMAQYGQAMVNAWSSGVYHQYAIIGPLSYVGLGALPNTMSGYSGALGSIEMGQLSTIATASSSPLTFPCQGLSGIPYAGLNETPQPPMATGSINGSVAWGTPIALMGNPSDSIVLLTATVTPTGSSTPVAVQILNSIGKSNADPNNNLASYQAAAYPSSPLQANTSYNVTLTGTVNGTAFSRAFSFTTGGQAG